MPSVFPSIIGSSFHYDANATKSSIQAMAANSCVLWSFEDLIIQDLYQNLNSSRLPIKWNVNMPFNNNDQYVKEIYI